MSEWTVRINGVDQANVKPGERLEIGRKPLRPLASDGNTRLDVADRTKSMSKRHAVLEVKEDGTASIRDLGSTNGSYVVRDNGDLLRLPPHAEFILPSSPMRMQFGDVPADFIELEHVPQEPDSVPNLFGYAVGEAPQEPDAADMSVDDILDLRAGEPTAIFSAENVKRKVGELSLEGLTVTQPLVKPEEPALPRDLFADALAQNLDDANAQETPKPAENKDSHDATPAEQKPASAQPSHARPVTISGVVPVDAIAHPVVRHIPDSVALAQPSVPDTEAEVSSKEGDETSHTDAHVEQSAQSVQPEMVVTEGVAPADDAHEPTTATVEAAAQEADDASAEAAQPSDEPSRNAQDAPNGDAAMPDHASDDAYRPVAAADETDTTGTYTPAFEPGSVFERVAKGELKAAEPVIEVAGITSDEARTTQDFNVQFEAARHPELMAFLAMNPYLYDDMYAWLAARGEADIDEALEHNQGYREYREAVGK
ncbi:FHA domain-containing protein [Bifidobacterium scaligerum]|uniref:FHA domain-containing protein n=1 Tax=Bifidobacterium scaligerum TaxID=2052656 RepID=UPI0013FE1FFC|nr:FHA domain-containing protein [Bifidobacterium scaligerum]